jgi:hypothetical protein
MCTLLADNIEQLSQTGPPTSVANIKIQGDTCQFTATTDWNSIKDLEVWGKLTCNKFADGQCVKSSDKEHCGNAALPDGTDRQVFTFCLWG